MEEVIEPHPYLEPARTSHIEEPALSIYEERDKTIEMVDEKIPTSSENCEGAVREHPAPPLQSCGLTQSKRRRISFLIIKCSRRMR